MKILFNGLGPNDTISYDGKLYRNGSVADIPDDFAAPYLSTHLAVKAQDEEVAALQLLEQKNAAKRSELPIFCDK